MQDDLRHELCRLIEAYQPEIDTLTGIPLGSRVEAFADTILPIIAREVATHLTDAAEYLDGYAGGHHMAQSCAQVLRERADAIRVATKENDDA